MKRLFYAAAMVALLFSSLLAARVSAQSASSQARASSMVIQLCTSGPYGQPAVKDVQQGVRNGVALAIFKWRPVLAKVGITIGPQINLDDALADGTNYSPTIEANNALKCIANKNVMGYVGALNSGASVASEPKTNLAHLVQISPANTNPGLTSVEPYGPAPGFGGRASQEPATFHHKIKWVTYYRTITTDALQGPAGAEVVANLLHAKTVFVVDDKTPYGIGLADAFQTQAPKSGLNIVSHVELPQAEDATVSATEAKAAAKANADAVYCGCNTSTTVAFYRDLRQDGYTKPYVGGDIFVSPSYLTFIEKGTTSAITDNMFGTLPGPAPSATSKAYRALYKKLFPGFYKSPGPGPYDATSYDAASIILDAIVEAQKAHELKPGATMANRTAVVKHVRFIHYCGATGCTHFDANGDTSNQIIGVYRTVGGSWVYETAVHAPKGLKPAP